MAANTRKTILASAARTASVDSADQTNAYHRGVRIHIDATVLPGAATSNVFTVQGKSASGDYYTILASAAIVGTGDTFLYIYPGGTAAANLVVNQALPAVWRVSVASGNANSLTYSVGIELFI
jgi:hypothetical protein